ncbi:hypothetical protein M011DRAFT_309663 [Sporormia fimetaria CBS 119925]|uniref:Uncharacterized protein n=1 Tax=Sporormia fimetaria CBS 119925 TaxID=1340428 RepID=A0A6A6VK24_9PLEO|nr:hypothetical protein M011DRAFT_309663 [Sporormia fimetaria CBS 119925]
MKTGSANRRPRMRRVSLFPAGMAATCQGTPGRQSGAMFRRGTESAWAVQGFCSNSSMPTPPSASGRNRATMFPNRRAITELRVQLYPQLPAGAVIISSCTQRLAVRVGCLPASCLVASGPLIWPCIMSELLQASHLHAIRLGSLVPCWPPGAKCRLQSGDGAAAVQRAAGGLALFDCTSSHGNQSCEVFSSVGSSSP